jgi:hypothetical protein
MRNTMVARLDECSGRRRSPPSAPELPALIGQHDKRPDLVLRFGKGPTLPFFARRPVNAVLVADVALKFATAYLYGRPALLDARDLAEPRVIPPLEELRAVLANADDAP